MRISSVFLSEVMLAAKLAGTGLPPTHEPREAPLPWPLAKTRSRPAVAPLAAAVNWLSAMSIDPGALADRNAGQRHRVAGVEPALRRAPDRHAANARPRTAAAATPNADRTTVQGTISFSSNGAAPALPRPAAADQGMAARRTARLSPISAAECVVLMIGTCGRAARLDASGPPSLYVRGPLNTPFPAPPQDAPRQFQG